jgi:hypothetical protein
MDVVSGSILRRKNFTSFAGTPTVKVQTVENLKTGQLRINGRFVVEPGQVITLSEEESKRILRIWEDCRIKEHVQVDGRVPCARSDGQAKASIAEDDVRAKLFEIRMRRDDLSFEAYRCPDCGQIHIGRNPYASKNEPGGV